LLRRIRQAAVPVRIVQLARDLLVLLAIAAGPFAAPGEVMLRMTRTESGPATTIFIEGKILGPWVPEIVAAIAAIPEGHRRRIDLAGVTFVDHAGIELVAMLRRDGVEVASCSEFIAGLLERRARNPQ
jgi:hypothetical protein